MWNLTISRTTKKATNLIWAVDTAVVNTNDELYQFKTKEEALNKMKEIGEDASKWTDAIVEETKVEEYEKLRTK